MAGINSCARLDPLQIAEEFGVDAVAWSAVCERSAAFYDHLGFLTVDPIERLQWRDRYVAAAHQIRAGARPGDVGIAAVGAEH